MLDDDYMRRRQYLNAAGIALTISTAGCQDSDGGNGGSSDGEPERTVNPSLNSDPSSCPPQSLSDAEAMPGQPDGFTVWDTIFREDDNFLKEDDTTYYADEITVWYDGVNEATYRLQIYPWKNATVAEEDWTFSPKVTISKGNEKYEMVAGLKARIEHITLEIWTDNGGQTAVESLYDSIACVDQSHIIEKTWETDS